MAHSLPCFQRCGSARSDDCDKLKRLIQVRSILGPNVAIRCPGYGSSEAMIGFPYDVNKLDEFALLHHDVTEFLDVSLDATHENLRQAVSI